MISPLVVLLPVLGFQGMSSEPAPFVELPPIFADGMVLQRETVVPVWGAARAGVEITIGASWLDADVSTTTDERGRWRAEVSTPGASGPHALVIAGDGAEVVVRDVWIGEVWLASGQSNMEWTLGPGVGPGTAGWREEVESANLPLVRFFHVDHQVAWEPRELAPNQGWISASPETAGDRSAVAYYFAKHLWEVLGVPIGVIESSWGGTPVEAWTSAEAQSADPELADELERLRRGASDPEGEAAREAASELEWWRKLETTDPGSRGRWMGSSVESREWRTTSLPATFRSHGEGDFDGAVWYRREFVLPETWAGAPLVLTLGAIDDRDTTWFNGVRVGGLERGGSWNVPRRYTLPAGLARAGRNVVAVRALDTGGAGGFTGSSESFGLERTGDDGTMHFSLAGNWQWRRGASLFDLPPLPPGSWLNEDRPAALFQGMIAPWVGYGLAGFIWYQGESNRLAPVAYRERFPRLIEDWRSRWQRGDLPFLFVQIAPHRYGGDHGEASELREAQASALSLPNTGMAVTTDLGDPDDIHPSIKEPVGERLARLALRRTYGRSEVVDEGPQLAGWLLEGPELRLAFENHGGRLVFEGDAPGPFYVAGEDRVFRRADVRVEGTDVVLSSTLVARPVAARFAWGAADHANFAGASGLPPGPFRTDAWPSVTENGPSFDPR